MDNISKLFFTDANQPLIKPEPKTKKRKLQEGSGSDGSVNERKAKRRKIDAQSENHHPIMTLKTKKQKRKLEGASQTGRESKHIMSEPNGKSENTCSPISSSNHQQKTKRQRQSSKRTRQRKCQEKLVGARNPDGKNLQHSRRRSEEQTINSIEIYYKKVDVCYSRGGKDKLPKTRKLNKTSSSSMST